MIFRKISAFHKNRVGFTLIEVIVALAITSLIALGASISIGQVLNQTSRNNDYTTASRNAMNALHWMSRDAMMAQSINGTAGFPKTQNLSLNWTEWDNSKYSASYTLTDGRLKRVFSKNGSQVSTTVIAEHINRDMTSTNRSSDNVTLTIKITSSVGEGGKVINVIKVREITSRPNL